MRMLLPLALLGAMLAIPAPPQKLRADIQAGHPTEPYRFAIAYQFGKGQPLHFGFHAEVTANAKTKLPECHFGGDFGLRLMPKGPFSRVFG